MRFLLLLTLLSQSFFLSTAQVSISPTGSPPHPSSMLDISTNNRGLLIPRLRQDQRNAINMPANALLIYQIDINPGFYYNSGTSQAPIWIRLSSPGDDGHLEDRIPIDSIPYNITTPGSYYVTDDLNGSTGINIMTSHVTLDLNGYALRGTPGNNSEGIEVTLAATNISIVNGSITGWGREGIKAVLATNSSFSQLHIVFNAFDGLATGNNNLTSYVIASNNGFDGIDMGESAAIFHSTAANNSNDGIEADGGSALSNCTARDNTQTGIRTTAASTISNCAASENNSHGFSCGAGSVIRQNVSNNNGQNGFYIFSSSTASENTARNNTQHGFEWLNDCIIESNNASLNSSSGFSTSFSGGKLDNNNSTSNSLHGYNIQGAGGCLVIRNTASGNGISAFNVLPGNTFATAVTPATINTNTNPFANFQL